MSDMNFSERIIGMFVNPDKTTEDIANKPRIGEALVIMGIYAILVMLSAYIVSSHISYVYKIPGVSQSGLQNAPIISRIITLAFDLALPLILWPVITGFLHIFARLFGGKGKFFPQMMTVLGYTDVVKIITFIIFIILFTQLPYVTVEISGWNILSTISSIMTSPVCQSMYFKAGNIVIILGMIISSLMGVFAIKNGEKLTLVQSAIVIGIPLLIYVIIELVILAIILL